MNHYLIMILAPVLMIHLFYLTAVIKKDLSVIDTAWGLGFVLISFVGVILSDFSNPRELLISAMVLIWGLRLAVFIHFRNHKRPEDFRYAQWRKDWGDKTNLIAYFKVYWLQLVLMVIVAAPIFEAHHNDETALSGLNYLGVVLWAVGLIWESVGDYQKSQFKKDPQNKNKIMTKGLWSLSRHPNYFGESLLWWGIALVTVSQNRYLGLIGSTFITFLLWKVSGVPMAEKKEEKNPAYQAYKAQTPALIPSLSKLMK